MSARLIVLESRSSASLIIKLGLNSAARVGRGAKIITTAITEAIIIHLQIKRGDKCMGLLLQ